MLVILNTLVPFHHLQKFSLSPCLYLSSSVVAVLASPLFSSLAAVFLVQNLSAWLDGWMVLIFSPPSYYRISHAKLSLCVRVRARFTVVCKLCVRNVKRNNQNKNTNPRMGWQSFCAHTILFCPLSPFIPFACSLFAFGTVPFSAWQFSHL